MVFGGTKDVKKKTVKIELKNTYEERNMPIM